MKQPEDTSKNPVRAFGPEPEPKSYFVWDESAPITTETLEKIIERTQTISPTDAKIISVQFPRHGLSTK